MFGIGHVTLIYVGKILEAVFNNDLALLSFPVNESLSGLRWSFAKVLQNTGYGIMGGFLFICLLVILLLMFRRRLYASIAIFVLVTIVEILAFTHSLVYLPITLIIAALWTLIISRFGLVAIVIHGVVFGCLQNTLFTLNVSAWYASSMLFVLFLVLLLLGYGFKVSLANQPLFAERLASD